MIIEIVDGLNTHFCRISTFEDINAVVPYLELKTESALDNILVPVHERDVHDAIQRLIIARRLI